MAKKSLLFISFVATICLYSCNIDSRVRGFQRFLLDRADSLAYSKCTEKEFIQYLKGYHEDPIDFEIWVDDLKKGLKNGRTKLYDDCNVIKELDREYGRELTYEEALKIVMAVPDTSAAPSKKVELQRSIKGIDYYTEYLTIWEEAQKWEQNRNQAAK